MTAPETSLQSRRWLVLASAVLSFLAVGVTFFAVPPLVGELSARFALTHLQVGVLMGAIAVPAIFLSVPLGAAIDRWPARAAGNLGLGAMVVGGAIFAAAPGYLALLTGRLIFGVGGLVVNLLLARLITTAFAGRELSLAMGVFNAVYPASMILIFSGHAWLLGTIGWRAELAALAVLAVVALPLHNAAVPRQCRGDSSEEADASPGQRQATASLAALATAWMMFFVAFASVVTFAPEWAGGGTGALLTTTAIMWVAMVLSPVVGTLIDRFGHPQRWAATGQLALGLVVAGMAAARLAPLPAMLLTGLVAATVPAATYSLPARLVPPQRIGFAFGVITAFSNLGTVVGPAAVGALRDTTGAWPLPWALAAAAALVGTVACLMVRPR